MNLPETISIKNSVKVLQWFVDDFTRSYEKGIVSISGLKVNDLKKVFGRQTVCKNYTHRNWIWRIKHNNRTFQILSSQTGTTVELETDYSKWITNLNSFEGDCIDFLEWMRAEVNSKLIES